MEHIAGREVDGEEEEGKPGEEPGSRGYLLVGRLGFSSVCCIILGDKGLGLYTDTTGSRDGRWRNVLFRPGFGDPGVSLRLQSGEDGMDGLDVLDGLFTLCLAGLG